MSKLTQPSVSDSFNSPSNRPSNPNEPNWKQMLFQLSLAIAGGIAFGVIMHFSNKSLIKGMAKKDDSKKQLAISNPPKQTIQSPSSTKDLAKTEPPTAADNSAKADS